MLTSIPAGLTTIFDLLIVVVLIFSLNYLTIRLYTMICAIHIGGKCRKNKLSISESKNEFERYFNRENEPEICRAGQLMVWMFIVTLLLCVLLWLYGDSSEQQAAKKLILLLVFVEIGTFAVGLITKNVSLFSLPPDAMNHTEEEQKTRLQFKTVLGKYNIVYLFFAALYAAVYWLLAL